MCVSWFRFVVKFFICFFLLVCFLLFGWLLGLEDCVGLFLCVLWEIKFIILRWLILCLCNRYVVCDFCLLKIVIRMFVLVILLWLEDWIWKIVCCSICWKFSVGCVLCFFLLVGRMGVVCLIKVFSFWWSVIKFIEYVFSVFWVDGLLSSVSNKCLMVINLWWCLCVLVKVIFKLSFSFWLSIGIFFNFYVCI